MTDGLYTRDNLAEFCAKSGSAIGEHTYGAPEVRWWGEPARLSIGRYCSIAQGVVIFLGGNHRTDWVSTYPFNSLPAWPEAAGIGGHPATRGDVTVGSDVWIGEGASILSGISIGHGAVIGARSVVTRSVAPYAIVAGNPARLIRRRFPAHVVDALLEAAWWDRTDDEVRPLVPLLMSGDVERLLSALGVRTRRRSFSKLLRWMR
ncbi:CatB-related O-acetyltransferase [Roseomonas sp. WA12]